MRFIPGLADNLRGDKGTDPRHREERMTGHELGEPMCESVLLLRERSEMGEALAGKLCLDADEAE